MAFQTGGSAIRNQRNVVFVGNVHDLDDIFGGVGTDLLGVLTRLIVDRRRQNWDLQRLRVGKPDGMSARKNRRYSKILHRLRQTWDLGMSA